MAIVCNQLWTGAVYAFIQPPTGEVFAWIRRTMNRLPSRTICLAREQRHSQLQPCRPFDRATDIAGCIVTWLIGKNNSQRQRYQKFDICKNLALSEVSFFILVPAYVHLALRTSRTLCLIGQIASNPYILLTQQTSFLHKLFILASLRISGGGGYCKANFFLFVSATFEIRSRRSLNHLSSVEKFFQMWSGVHQQCLPLNFA